MRMGIIWVIKKMIGKALFYERNREYMLMQWIEDGRIRNYTPDNHPRSYPTKTTCVFHVKRKKNITLVQKINWYWNEVMEDIEWHKKCVRDGVIV
jgi:hypothetical protein